MKLLDAAVSFIAIFIFGVGTGNLIWAPTDTSSRHHDQRVICEYQHHKWIDNKCYSNIDPVKIVLPK